MYDNTHTFFPRIYVYSSYESNCFMHAGAVSCMHAVRHQVRSAVVATERDPQRRFAHQAMGAGQSAGSKLGKKGRKLSAVTTDEGESTRSDPGGPVNKPVVSAAAASTKKTVTMGAPDGKQQAVPVTGAAGIDVGEVISSQVFKDWAAACEADARLFISRVSRRAAHTS